MNISKYEGVIPAFYACYDEAGKISPARVEKMTEYLIEQGVKGLYVGGSSGECIYQSKEERKLVLEHVVKAAKSRVTIIAHVACNNTEDSMELAAHAEGLHVDAIAAIPPIYFHLPEYGIAGYWNDISSAAPHTDFIIYNIPQLAGTALGMSLLKEMLKNPNVIGVKNSSMPVQDIQMWKAEAGAAVVMNGPDEQFLSGLAAGATGGIGGTYAVMPKLYIKIYECYRKGDMAAALAIQNEACHIIYHMCTAKGNLYAVMKAILKKKGIEAGGVRKPLVNLMPEDKKIVDEAAAMIEAAENKYCK